MTRDRESQLYGYSDWRLPSPSSTPKAPNLSSPSLRTPKSAGSPSYFLDAFSTPRPNGQTTPAQKPLFGTFTVVERPASPKPRRPPRPDDPEFHVNHPSSTPHLQLPPVSPARRLSSSPDLSSTISIVQQPAAHPPSSINRPQTKSSMNPFQMQTPPPTRDASSRRKMPPPQMGISGTPSTIAPRPVGTPMMPNQMQPPQPLNIQTPFQYNPLQFSPENFQFPSGGPASAPVYPQSRLFWDPSSPNATAGMEVGAQLNDPFGPSPQMPTGMPVWPTFDQQPRQSPSLSFHQTPQQQPRMQSNDTYWSPGDVIPQHSTPFSQPSQPPATTGVDPSMLVSFSDSAPSALATIQPQQTEMTHPQGNRQPYEHQLQESRREQEIARKVKQQHARTNTASSSSTTSQEAKPGLHRSNTDSGFRRKLKKSTDSRLSTQSTEQAIPRKASPSKRLSQQTQAALTAIPEAVRIRPRTRLVIGEDGRARTETVPADDDSDNRRRSGLWDQLDSDSDTEAEDTVPSQRSSFIFPSDTLHRRSSKHARIDSSAELSKANRSSSSSSLSNIPLGIRRSASSSSRRSHTKIDPRRFSSASFGAGSFTSDGAERGSGTWDMEGVEEGDAQLALKRVVEDRLKRHDQASPEDILKAHNQRWSLASADVAKLQPFVDPPTSTPSAASSSFQPSQTISPSAFADSGFNNMTPQTDRTSLSQESIHCVCQVPEDDGTQMIQCESCMRWQHTRCLNLHNIPPVYVCIFCTGNTPIARGGRVREPMRLMPQQHQQNYASPLAGRGRNPFG